MASTISYDGLNSGVQVGQNNGHITAQFALAQSGTPRSLACLRDLRTTNPRDDKDRIKNTNGGLLKESYRWILDSDEFIQWQDNQDNRLLWIRGDPGKGKTMLLCGVIEELTQSIGNTANILFFFCQASDSRINTATAVLRGLIYLLVEKEPSLLSHIQSEYDGAGKPLFEDANAWTALERIFSSILDGLTFRRIYIIIDALDECTIGRDSLLAFIVKKSSTHSNTKWIVSSRNWPTIEEMLDNASQETEIRLELNETSVRQAVGVFIENKVDKLTKKKGFSSEIRNTVHNYLMSNANGTFLWVALVCQYLDKTPRDHLKKLRKFPPGLRPLYRRMMDEIILSETLEHEEIDLCKRILAFMAIVYRPITLRELVSFTGLSVNKSEEFNFLKKDIALCGSFLTVRDDIIYFVHQSAKEFLVENASNEIFPTGIEQLHYTVFSRSLQAMSKTLRRNIFSLCSLGLAITQVKRPNPDPLSSVQYSCIYWVDHLHDSHSSGIPVRLEDLQYGGMVDKFLRANYLHWLEALSIIGGMPDGAFSMLKLEDLVQESVEEPGLAELVQDARRFFLYHKWSIENSPLQVYASALVFSPSRSVTRTMFELEAPNWITNKPIEDDWSACLQTLEAHTRPVTSVVLSHDSKLLASASNDHNVKIWNTDNGQCLHILDGHSGPVNSLTLSRDSKLLASASDDETINVWNTSTWQCLQTLKGHRRSVLLIVFTHDSNMLASASSDSTIKIWDTRTGQCVQTLEGHDRSVTSIVFSHNYRLLASGSDDHTIRIWNVNNGKSIQTLEGYSSSVTSVVTSIVFSNDSKLLTSISENDTIKTWDTSNWQRLQTLEGHRSTVTSIVVSHDFKILASGSKDTTVMIWDLSNGQCLQMLEGHSHSVTSVIFSHNYKMLASASIDNTIKIWDTSSGQCLQTLKGHRVRVAQIIFSHDSRFIVSASNDKTVKIWDANYKQFSPPPDGHHDSVTSVIFSSDSQLLASVSNDSTVKIWDIRNGQCLQTIGGSKYNNNFSVHHGSQPSLVAFSHNFEIFTWPSDKYNVEIRDTSSGQCRYTIKCHQRELVTSIAFSRDSKLIGLGLTHGTVMVWVLSDGKCLQTFQCGVGAVISVAFSHDSRLIAAGLNDNLTNQTIRVLDISNDQCSRTLEGHIRAVTSVLFSHNSKMLVSASVDNTIKTWDTSNWQCLQTLKGHLGWISSLVFSQDSKLLASASKDKTVKIWDTGNAQCLQTLRFETVVSVRKFDATKSLLEIDLGTIRLSLDSSPRPTQIESGIPQFQGYGVSPDRTWITWNSQNLLWLPLEYRPSAIAVAASNLTIGCDSGRVLIFNFDSQTNSHSLART
ncbi:hypothetical protein N7494_009742 [Penicillium frequentans]|uniref:Mitochondrial division protein 1 n=1 Tax=Penicillium frequentans TaxID=3151616 RepID=A0AAD6CQX2_9EURO|nr:hypothetical protein N7494_009742 [Penicillium glabrum]